jgi:hypothetical protein
MDVDFPGRLERAFAEAVTSGPDEAALVVEQAYARDPALCPQLGRMVAKHFERLLKALPPAPVPTTRAHLPDRFHDIAFLGSGGFGDVYRVWDRHAHALVAVKVLHARQAESLFYFKQEFRALQRVQHDNIVTLYEGFFLEEPWMFTMEYVDGVDLLKYVAGEFAPTRYQRARSCFRQLAEGVDALHQQGLFHRDLKPSNVLVTPAGRVKLLDFGLVRDNGPGADSHQSFVGTWDYMSPELRLGEPVTAASDWYAVGVMLYEALTGAKPRSAPQLSPSEAKGFSAPTTSHPAVPRDLSELCVRLLARDPAQRPSRAEICALATEAELSVSASRPDLSFVGRIRELDQLGRAFERSQRHPVVVQVSGPPGIGKSALLRRWLGDIHRRVPAPLVLAARCYENESVSYPALDDLVDRLSGHMRHLPEDEVNALRPRNFAALVRMFPVLAPFRVGPDIMPARDSSQLHIRGFAALADLLGRLAEQRRVVITVDDLQWGDREGCAFLSDLMAAADAPRLLLILAYRSEAREVDQWLRGPRDRAGGSSTTEYERVDLSGLSAAETEQLTRTLLIPTLADDHGLVGRIARTSDSSPYLVDVIAAWANARGAGASVEHVSTETVVRAKVAALSEDSRRLLELIAVAGQPTALKDLRGAYAFQNVLAARDDLRRERLTKSRNVEDREEIEAYHDLTRVAVVQGLLPAELIQRHLALARALAQDTARDPERVAMHYESAGDVAACAVYALEGADRAFEALAFERAAVLYLKALRAETLPQISRAGITRRRAEALASAGRCQDAARAYTEAAVAADRRERLELTAKAADQMLRAADFEKGLRVLDDVMAEVHVRPWRNRTALLLRAGFLRLRIWLSGLKFRENPERDLPESTKLRLDVCWTGAMVTSFIDPLRSAESSARYVLLALRSGNPAHIANALTCEAPMLCLTPSVWNHAKARQLLETARDLSDRVDKPHTRARYLLANALVSFLQGHWKNACGYADQASDLLRTKCVNVIWELATANIYGCAARFIRGEWEENRRRWPMLVRDVASPEEGMSHLRTESGRTGGGNVAASLRVHGCAYLLDLAADEPAHAAEQLCQDVERWSYVHADFFRCNVLQAEIDIALYEDDPWRAHEAIERSWKKLERARLLRNPTTFAFLHFARGRAALAMASGVADTRRRRALLNRAETDSRALSSKGPTWSAGMGAVIQAGLSTWRGDSAAVTQHLLLADRAFEAADMQPTRVAVAYHLARITGPDRRGGMAEEWAAREGVVDLARVVAALAPGRYDTFYRA